MPASGPRKGGYPAPVRRFWVVTMLLALTAAACGGGGGGGTDDAAAPATTAAASGNATTVPTTTAGSTVPATNLTLHLTDVHLVNSEESDNGVRILLPAGVATASVTLSGLPSPNRVVSVCQANDLDRRLTSAVCRMPASGEAVTVALGSTASGVEIVQAGVSGSGAAGNATTLDDVTIKYAASTREVNVRFPQIAAGDEGGRPTFGLTPAGTTGAYKATLTWTVIQVFGGTASNGQLELVQGGNVADRAASSGLQVLLNGNVPQSAGDAAVRLQNIGSAALVTPKLTLLLP